MNLWDMFSQPWDWWVKELFYTYCLILFFRISNTIRDIDKALAYFFLPSFKRVVMIIEEVDSNTRNIKENIESMREAVKRLEHENIYLRQLIRNKILSKDDDFFE